MELLVLPLPLLIFDVRLSHDMFSSWRPFTMSVDLFLVPWGALQFEKGHSCPLQELSVDSCAPAEQLRATLPSPHLQDGSDGRARVLVVKGFPGPGAERTPCVSCSVVRGQARKDIEIMSLLGHL